MLSLVIGLVVKFSFHGYRDFQSMETKENLSKYQLQIMETNNESVFLKTKIFSFQISGKISTPLNAPSST